MADGDTVALLSAQWRCSVVGNWEWERGVRGGGGGGLGLRQVLGAQCSVRCWVCGWLAGNWNWELVGNSRLKLKCQVRVYPGNTTYHVVLP